MDLPGKFAAVLASPNPSLLDGALCIAAVGGRDVDSGGLEFELDRFAADVSDATLAGVVGAMSRDYGFRGDNSRYDDPRHSCIDQVVARRLGIPITLALVAIEIGRRAGVELTPVGMPGHFLVGASGEFHAFGDPFHGRVIDRDGCADIVRRLSGGARTLRDNDLAPTPAAGVFARMLNNLEAGPWGRDLRRLGALIDLHVCIGELGPADRFALVQKLESLGRYDEAASQLDQLGRAVDEPARPRLATRATGNRARYN